MWRQVLEDVIRRTVSGFTERLAAFGPNLLAMLVLLGVGLVGAGVVRLLLRLVLPRLGFDRFSERVGLTLVLRNSGIARPPSEVVGLAFAWAVLGVFVLLAIGALNLQFAMDLLTRSFTYLPHILIAAALLVLGALVSGFFERSVLIAAVNAGLPSARLLAGVVRTGLMVLFIAMALEHLGLGRQVVIVSFTIVFGGVVLALALAFGLAGRDLARELLERMVRREEKRGEKEIEHL
jgi:hypothetical protein